MKNKINVAKLLHDCPSGMELDCTIFDNVILDEVNFNKDPGYPIRIVTKHGTILSLSKYGTYIEDTDAKCVIFPKGKTTWEGFTPPCRLKNEDKNHLWTIKDAKDGDVIVYDDGWTCIFRHIHGIWFSSYCFITSDGEFHTSYERHSVNTTINGNAHLASEEEKEEFFNALNDNGYCWDDKTKTLEKLIKPKPKPRFKCGDKIRHKRDKTIIKTIGYIYKDSYALYDGRLLFFSEQDQYELIPNKFDILSLKPFTKVLVRDFDNETWEINFFSKLLDGKHFKCHGSSYVQCIPYKGNEHLHNTTNTCHPFYKTWEK